MSNKLDDKSVSRGEDIPLAGLLKSHPETAFDYLEFRFITAGMSAHMAAKRATDEERQTIKEAYASLVAAFESDDIGNEYLADRDFHLAIYAASHNPVMEHVMRHIFVLLHQDAFYDRNNFRGREGVRELLFRQHKAIFDAVMARDPDVARHAAEKHVLYIRDSLQESRIAEQRSAVAMRRVGRANLVQINDQEG